MLNNVLQDFKCSTKSTSPLSVTVSDSVNDVYRAFRRRSVSAEKVRFGEIQFNFGVHIITPTTFVGASSAKITLKMH